ncbi:MAG: hypothetical protein IPN22_12275 [Bacteroidetes bacterium]|nr:hypothetical protein [Bacteroidota bacterium]
MIKPNHPAYITYLGLFLTMSNPLLIVPKLEHHLKQFLKHDLLGRGAENFLGEIEFTVCNAIRTARFPEDYHVKHDKIISWVYNKRESEQYRKEMNAKLDALILGINRISPKQNISKEVIRQKPGRKKGEQKEIFVLPKMVEQFITDLTGYLNKNSHDALRKILRGEAESALIVNFDGQASQLIDVFRIYTEAGYIKAEKRSVANWITKHFMYRNERLRGFVPFDVAATERIIYHYNPVDKDKRVNLKGLPKLQESYYTNRKKTYSDTNSYD